MQRSLRFAAPLCLALCAPAGALAQDSDADGVLNSADVFPCNASRAGVAFAPAEGVFGTLMFEDHWPNKDDQDFNDAVFAYNAVYITNAAGDTTILQLTLQTLALGGTFTHGLGLQLPVPAAQITSITRTVGTTTQDLVPSTQDANLTVHISADLREFYGFATGPINALNSQSYQASPAMVVNVTFAPGTQLPASSAPEDLFIFRSNRPAHEIHRPGFAGTSNMDQSLFGTADDGSAPGRSFVDQQGLPFALVLPELTPYPSERTTISQLFPTINEFAASAGTLRQDFYKVQVNLSAQYLDAQGLPTPAPSGPAPLTVDNSCVNPFQAGLIVDMPFNGTDANLGSWSVSRIGSPAVSSSGGADSNGFASGLSNRSHCWDMADIAVGGTGQHTFAAWYNGTQTNSSGRPYQTGVLIFGDPAGSVWLGLGTDQGKIAIANGNVARGTTNVADGQWHQLVWTRSDRTWNLYVDGQLEVANYNAGGSTSNQYLRDIACGYGYAGTASPSALDGVQIYDSALAADEVLRLFDPNAPLALCTDGIQNGAETGVDCGGSRCAGCPAVPILTVTFDASVNPQGSLATTVQGSVTANSTGGVLNSGYGSGFVQSSAYLDNADIHVGGTGENSFSAWYRGAQTNSSASPYQTGVLIFGDHTGSVYLGLGLDAGKIAIANGSIGRGTTTISDGQWHHLTWVRINQRWDAYVDGVKEINGFSATVSTGNQYIRRIGSGYPYGGTAAPTQLDEIQIYDKALGANQISALANP